MSERRLPSLDMLRGLAALAVVLPHLILSAHPRHGTEIFEAIAVLGVEVFFVLSGFVLAPQILMCLARPSLLPTFLVRRWARTVPPFVLALCIVSLMTDHFGSNDFLRYLIYCQNLFKQHNTYDYFTVAWSLSVEEWFYILFPMCLIAISPLLRRDQRTAVVAAVTFIVAVTITRTIFGNYAEWGADVRRVVLFRIDSIAYGFLLYILIGTPRAGVSFIGAMASAVLAFFALWGAANHIAVAEAAFPLTAAVYGCFSLVLALSLNDWIARSRILTWTSTFAGRISYSTYLFHSIFAMVLMDRLAPMPLAYRAAITLGVTIVFCTVLYYAYEKPILAARPQYGKRRAAAAGSFKIPST